MLELFFTCLAVFVPLIFSCLLSAAETAITAVSTAKLHKLKKDGSKQAIVITELKEDKEGLISTILFANNLCNIISSTMATAFLIGMFGDEGVIYATFIMTILIIIFAEILPKTYAIASPEKVALKFSNFLRITVLICRPIVRLINTIIAYINKLFKLNEHSQQHLVSPTDEIKGAIDLHHKQGSVDQHDKYMLDGVFYLSETDVNKVMTHRKNMHSIDLNLSLKEILNQVKEIGHARIPVWKENPDNIIGILNTRELLNKNINNNSIKTININEAISEPMFVHENTALDEQLVEFKARKSRFAIVIDEYGDIQGIITLSDILEEVIGHIQDENDKESEEIILNGNTCLVKGEMPIRDINRMLSWHLPEEEASTIAGLIIHEAEKIPEIDEVFNFYGFEFTILARKNNQLTNIKIKKNSDQTEN